MKQNPRELINDVHERIADDNSDQQILSGYSEDPEIWGVNKVWLFIALLPAMGMLRFSTEFLTGMALFYGLVATVALAAFGIIVTVASPGDMEAQEYFKTIISKHAHQQEMVHDTNPDESRIEQPKNDSLLGQFTRLPLVRDWPVIGAGDYEPTQSLVAFEKAFRGTCALKRDDGSLVAAIRVRAIPLRLESESAKKKVEKSVANALEGTVDYSAQWISPTRVADMEHRRTQWKDRARAFQSQADRLVSAHGDATAIDAIRKQILADIADERAAGINLQQDTKRMREHFVLLSVDPGEAVVDRSSEAGGLASVPMFGRLVEEYRLWQESGSEEHVTSLISKLEDRANDLESELNRIDGLTPNTMSSIEFSETIADYYRGVNVRAHDEFTDSVRGSPVPDGEDAGDPEHDTTYQHIANRDRAGSPQTPSSSPTSTHVTDGGTAADGGTTTADETDGTASSQEPSTPQEPSVEENNTSNLNEDALVGLAADDEELSWRYKTALAPDKFRRYDDCDEFGDCGEIDGQYYTKTLEVRDWPAIPSHGFFDRVVSFSMPKVDVTLSTHLTGEDGREADRKLAGTADSLKQKVKELAKNKWVPDYFVEQVIEEYADVKRTQNTVSASEYGLYTSQTYIEVRAPTSDKLETAVKRIRSRMQDVSADAKPLKQNRLGYRTAAPACKNYLGSETKMTGKGIAKMIPWTARNLIEPDGIELGINEDTGDPLVLDLQNRETGFNVGIWGTIGSGKTTTMTRLLTRSKQRNPDMPVVIIDPKREFAGFTWLFDGQTVTIGSDTGVNPLQIEETPDERLEEIGIEAPYRNAVRRAMDFARSFYAYQGIPFEDKQGTWRTAIQEAYRRRGIKKDDPSTHSNDSPTLADDVFPIFEEMVTEPEEFVRDALVDDDDTKQERKITAIKILQNDIGALEENGEFEHLSHETTLEMEDIDVLYLDLQNYESETTAGLMMGPLLTAVLELGKKVDEPMQIAMDEFHYMLHNSSSLATLKQAYRHSRHSDLSMITATQSVEEFFTENDEGGKQLTKSASQLTNLMSVKIWHFLEEMNDEWADEFDMSASEQQRIDDAATGDPTAQALLQLQQGGSYRLDVNFTDKLNPREFAMNQFDPSDHGTDPLAYLSSYTDTKGRDACEWTWRASSIEEAVASMGGNSAATDSEEGGLTADVADVNTDTGDVTTDTDKDEKTESNIRPANEVIEATSSDEEQSDGIAARLKQSVTDGKDADDELPLTALGGVTARTAGDLQDAGFETVEQVYEADESALAEIDEFDAEEADTIQAEAAEALGIAEDEPDSEATKAGSDLGVEADAAETETGSNDSATEQEPDDKPTATVEFTPGNEDATETADSGGDADDTSGDGDQSAKGQSYWSRIKESVSSSLSHPAAGKTDPDLTDIGMVDDGKAAALRDAGFETVEQVYTADRAALTEAEDVADETFAGVLQDGAKQTLDASDATLPEQDEAEVEEAETTDEDGSEPVESTDQPTEDPQSSESAPDEESADVDDTAAESNGDEPAELVLVDIKHVGNDRAEDLRAEGYESVADVAAVGPDTLVEVEGVGEARAETMSASASDLLEHSEGAVAEPAGGDD